MGGVTEVHLVAGTRPEAIKLAPLVPALRAQGMTPVFVASGQHPTMVHQALNAFGLEPDVTLSIDRGSGSQAELMAALTMKLEKLWQQRTPAAVVVQGDTTTVLAAAMVAFWAKLPVAHLEAGLRSHDLAAPFPEEGNRKLVGQISRLHLAPTARARANLEREGTPAADIVVTGNTVIDAVLGIAARGGRVTDSRVAAFVERARTGASRLVLVTAHRRESWGEPLDRVLNAVALLLEKYSDVEVVLPAHPNPVVAEQVRAVLGAHPRVLVTEPLAYPVLVGALAASTLVLSDSGGIQEEAPSFGVPVIVLREVTERMEAVDAGCAILVGTDRDAVLGNACRLLDDPDERTAMVSKGNPFGDGRAAERSAAAIAWMLGRTDGRPAEFRF
ncbi:UDP-N-acetylglucosamine 2-epimerase [Mycolicibacterium monacense]|uniref:UDP-N-acetylglucosamine 2-epimerase (non-hydrolyzing) n=1 Tax=Mycolicibacterium monacense TaxID=85693 RepID=A0AAD1MZV6_MYCMB|nr:UDP-N-acetylglucosamine 2-epimerase [Mycolicibacterium monacense DSM 44395]OBB55625.1 UDP-N-acetylglucosamine 2-epimerase [Mycolicibacterium monacense]OBF46983.1 UDP-N-acetylglucosamine 2-epimerase [Mycolicibacterium monacense]ORB23301.1 UDP-N-acetylglucosamine 2-epimerase (non-hydrolyzing) [Mycolicibacterium monacense DSM 44395]QHP85143.1 UDP-N-acetylglucosamine 2-epimerase (non-hydrolyzing) [Mycolicibacterium monacense DSM 44395]